MIMLMFTEAHETIHNCHAECFIITVNDLELQEKTYMGCNSMYIMMYCVFETYIQLVPRLQ